MDHRFSAELWEHHGEGSWHFVTLPPELSDEIEDSTADLQRGFGSVRVRVTIGSSTWSTSLFPSNEAEAYVLPVKKPVRIAEGLSDGDLVDVHLEIDRTERSKAR